MADAFESVGITWAADIIYFCALFGITAAAFNNQMSQIKCA